MRDNMSSHESEHTKDFVASLSRGLSVIRCFDKSNDRLTLSDVAKICELNRATARRFLFTLRELGYVQSDGKLFWLAPKILELGYAYLASQPIVDTVQPYIEQVSSNTGESCSVSVLDDFDVIYIARYLTHHIMSVTLNVGTRLPAYVTSMGRVMLAHKSDDEVEYILSNTQIKKFTEKTTVDRTALKAILKQVRKDGFAIVSEELELGLISIAAPIMNQRGQVVAAINVSSQSARVSHDDLKKNVLPHLIKAAEEIKNVLPY